MENTNETPVTPAATTPAETPVTPREPFAVFPDSESFEKRLAREVNKRMKEAGIEDPTKLSDILAEHKNMRSAAEEAERAKLSEVERLNADLRSKDEALARLQAEAEERELRLRLHDVFGRKGVKNYEYGYFKVIQKANALTDADEPLDLDTYVDSLMNDDTEKHALGVVNAAPPPQKLNIAPPPTSPHNGGAPTPTPPGSPAPSKTAFDYSHAEWEKIRRERYGV